MPFIVRIRDDDHMPLKGVKVGDLGAKLGYSSMDNGWLSFDHLIIPRTKLLSRFCEITKEGDIEIKGKLRYLGIFQQYHNILISLYFS